eukprot:5461140-Pleurochrysis_carterae.AAC.1
MSSTSANTAGHENENDCVCLSDFPNLYRKLFPWKKEFIARRWVKQDDKYFANASICATAGITSFCRCAGGQLGALISRL